MHLPASFSRPTNVLSQVLAAVHPRLDLPAYRGKSGGSVPVDPFASVLPPPPEFAEASPRRGSTSAVRTPNTAHQLPASPPPFVATFEDSFGIASANSSPDPALRPAKSSSSNNPFEGALLQPTPARARPRAGQPDPFAPQEASGGTSFNPFV
jgi:hypothetical protein